jgi:hypothetical protein
MELIRDNKNILFVDEAMFTKRSGVVRLWHQKGTDPVTTK